MEILTLLIILLGQVIHRYLSIYDSQGLLPHILGFRIFLIIFLVGSFSNFIWLFGFIFGIILFLLSIFQVIYSSYLWVFLLPFLDSIEKKQEIPPINNFVYDIWRFLSVGLVAVFIVNIFSGKYMYILNQIKDNISLLTFVIIFVITILAGNFARIKTLKT